MRFQVVLPSVALLPSRAHLFQTDPCHLVWQVRKIRRLEEKTQPVRPLPPGVAGEEDSYGGMRPLAPPTFAGLSAGLNCEDVLTVNTIGTRSDKRCVQNLIHLPGKLAGVLPTDAIFSSDGISLTCHAR